MKIPGIQSLEILSVWHCYQSAQAGLRSTQLTLTSLLATVPIIAIIFGVLRFTPALQDMQTQLINLIETYLTPGSSAAILPYLLNFVEQTDQLPLFGLIMLLMTALLLLYHFETSVQKIWQIEKNRPPRERLLTYWAVLTLGPILLAAFLSLYGVILSFQWRGLVIGATIARLVDISGPLFYFIMLFGLNYLTPALPVRPKYAAIAAFSGTLGLLLINKVFTSFAQLFSNYTIVYGTFAALPTFLIWLNISWQVVLLSVCLCATLQKTVFIK